MGMSNGNLFSCCSNSFSMVLHITLCLKFCMVATSYIFVESSCGWMASLLHHLSCLWLSAGAALASVLPVQISLCKLDLFQDTCLLSFLFSSLPFLSAFLHSFTPCYRLPQSPLPVPTPHAPSHPGRHIRLQEQ